MTRVATFLLLFAGIFTFSLTGCGGHKAQVIEAPAESGDGSAMEGISDEDYNKEMEEAMNRQQ